MRRPVEDSEATNPRIIARIQGGEVGALGVLFDRYANDVRRVVARLGISAADVDDVVQATFIDVLRAASRYDGRDNAKPWLVGLAVIHVRRHRRSLSRFAARVAALAFEPTASAPSPEDESASSQLADRTRRALGKLSPKKREVVVLVTIEGLSGEEAAVLLGIPVATVWTRLHHARRELNATVFEGAS